jgi:hypothetical protein
MFPFAVCFLWFGANYDVPVSTEMKNGNGKWKMENRK